MKIVRELTVEDVARRVLRFVPELDFTLLCIYLRSQGRCSLSESNVHGWVQFFDRFVIDGKELFNE